MAKPLQVVLILLGFAALLSVGFAVSLYAGFRVAGGADPKRTLMSGGIERTYLLHIPPNLPADKQAPLVLIFHGGGGRALGLPRFTHFDDLADQEGFVAAYPDGVNGHWNDTRGESDADDVSFVRAVIDDIERAHSIDSRRIYATGISNGGFFSNRLACELSDKIAAIASVAATMPEPLASACKPLRPLSVLYIQGTEDPLVPIDGGKVGFRRGRGRGDCTSLAEAAKFWRDQDHIHSAAAVEDLPVRVNDGTSVRRETWSSGADRTEVVVYTILGGGHTWPGAMQYLPKFVVGTASQNLDATRAIWNFFRSHSLH